MQQNNYHEFLYAQGSAFFSPFLRVTWKVVRGRWKCRSGKVWSDNWWKAVIKEKRIGLGKSVFLRNVAYTYIEHPQWCFVCTHWNVLMWKSTHFAVAVLKTVHTGDYSRRFRRHLSPKTATVADSHRFLRQSPFSVTVWSGQGFALTNMCVIDSIILVVSCLRLYTLTVLLWRLHIYCAFS